MNFSYFMLTKFSFGFSGELDMEELDHYYETKSIQVLEYGKEKKWAFPI